MNSKPIPLTRIFLIGVGAVVLIGLYFLTQSGKKPTPPPSVTLSLWGTENQKNIDALLSVYKSYRPNVTVTYRQIPADSYDQEVVSGLAAGNGPDLIFIRNNSLNRNISLLTQAPATQFSVGQMNIFPDVAATDFVRNNQVYALPLYLDPLMILANQDLLNQAGLANPPATWKELLSVLPSLETRDSNNNLIRAALAMGDSSRSISHSSDILTLLLLQNNTVMVNPHNNQASFADKIDEKNPGLDALNFYLQFGNSGNPNYSWDNYLGNSLNIFTSGKLAMTFGYPEDLAQIKEKNPYLKAILAPAFQNDVQNSVNFAHYQGLAVTKQCKQVSWAWDLISLLSSQDKLISPYLSLSGHQPALKSMLTDSTQNKDRQAINRAILTARSWNNPNDIATSQIFDKVIESSRSGEVSPEDALRSAANQISALLHDSSI